MATLLRESDAVEVHAWIAARPINSQLPLKQGEACVLNLQLGADAQAGQPGEPPPPGLKTDWVVTSRTVKIAPLDRDTRVQEAVVDDERTWTARFRMRLSHRRRVVPRSLQITPVTVDDASLDVLVFALTKDNRSELYRRFRVEFQVE